MSKFNSSRVFASAQKKLEEKGITRPDLALSDYRMIADDRADILIAYAGEVPSMQEIVAFVGNTCEGKLFPLLETARTYDLNNVVGIQVTTAQFTRPKSDAHIMMPVTASTFMDVADGSEWTVRTNETTQVQYLARSVSEDVEGILRARKERQGSRQHVTASATFDKVTASYLTANEDDYVKFFDGGSMRAGVIKSVQPDGMTLKILDDSGELFVTDRRNVTEVIRKDPKEQEQITRDMETFYSRIYGPDFAKQLFRFGSKV